MFNLHYHSKRSITNETSGKKSWR